MNLHHSLYTHCPSKTPPSFATLSLAYVCMKEEDWGKVLNDHRITSPCYDIWGNGTKSLAIRLIFEVKFEITFWGNYYGRAS